MTAAADEGTIQNRRPPKEFYSELDSVVEHQVKSREAFDRAINIAQSHGFSDFEIILFIKDYLKDKIPHTSLYRYISELSQSQQPQPAFPLGQIDGNKVLEENTIVNIKVSDIKIGERVRGKEKVDRGLLELAGSIAIVGLINPITINKDKLLVVGYRRLKACEMLRWERIPAIIKDITATDRLIMAQLTENTRLNFTKEECERLESKYGVSAPKDYTYRDLELERLLETFPSQEG